ncbi:MAG TPA: ATP-dependent Clp protease adaptor ClpS, partial [Marinobacter hydrocarbonoclasticus]|nr:ATP-dependent Clp protease adaptor ClpS [Marinobacter nauticus]
MRTIENSLLVFNQGEDEQPGRHEGVSVAPEKPALKRPARYRVVLLNDD